MAKVFSACKLPCEIPIYRRLSQVLASTFHKFLWAARNAQKYPRSWIQAFFEFLSPRFAKTWSQALAENLIWTEQCLYYPFLEMTGRYDAVCSPAGCNAVLDLERSVWQSSDKYRSPRPYDVDHFTKVGNGQVQGIFIAIQSWLAVASWLPTRYKTVQEFYQDLEKWLITRDP